MKFLNFPSFRLVSAYEDKFKHENVYYGQIGRKIRLKYGALNFQTFIRMILDEVGCRLEKVGYCDNHWKTYLSKCGYCDIQYQYFVRSERFETDSHYIGVASDQNFSSLGKYEEN